MNDNEQLNLHEQHLELQSSQAAKFSSSSQMEFWCSMLQEYPELGKRALEKLIPFPTISLCVAAMSTHVDIKTTYRNHLRVANDMRIALSNITPYCACGRKIQKVYEGCKSDSMRTSAQAGGRKSR